MDNPRPEKVAVVAEVRERLGSAAGALLTEYRGLTVSEMARLRRSLREAGGEYKVYKNTLVRFAVRDLGLDELEELLSGPTAIAFVDGDPAAVAKALRDFSRVNPNLVIKGGLLGGNVLSAQRAGALAELPSREVLLSRLAGGLAAPMQQLAGLLQALPRNLAYGLKALIDKGGAPGAPADAPAAAASPADGPVASDAPAPAGPAPAEEAPAPAAAEEAPPAVPSEPAVASEPVAEAVEDEVVEAGAVEAEAAAPRVDEVSDASPTPEAEPEAEPGCAPPSDVSHDSENQ
ncbi:MAG TPA: 50S ribosomal protein L10, partial [Acidimicrobiales bacterium]|nr:50S ribosomal protein L10 [Acidimicrobiales bacterium]